MENDDNIQMKLKSNDNINSYFSLNYINSVITINEKNSKELLDKQFFDTKNQISYTKVNQLLPISKEIKKVFDSDFKETPTFDTIDIVSKNEAYNLNSEIQSHKVIKPQNILSNSFVISSKNSIVSSKFKSKENLNKNEIQEYDHKQSFQTNQELLIQLKNFKLLEKNNIEDNLKICRVCLENDLNTKIISPCKCSGSVKYIHSLCVKKSFESNKKINCEILSGLTQGPTHSFSN